MAPILILESLLVFTLLLGIAYLIYIYTLEKGRKKEALRNLRFEHEALTLALEGGNTYAWCFDGKTAVLDQAFCELTNRSQNLLGIEEIAHYVHPDEQARFRKNVSNILYRQRRTAQYRCQFNDTGYQWWEFRYSVLQHYEQNPIITGLLVNIQEIKDKEEELIRARKLAEQAENSTIHNCQGYGLAISYAKVQVYNTQISNTLNHCLYVEGGHVDVNNSTIAQFYPFNGNRRSAIGFKAPIDTLDVRNSLVTGYGNDEVLWTPVEEEPLKFCFDHCVLRTEKMMTEDSLRFTHVVYEDVKDTTMYGEKHFSVFDTENLIYDFHLSAKSAAIGAADPKTALPYDRNGLKREEDKADAGCFLYREEKKEE